MARGNQPQVSVEYNRLADTYSFLDGTKVPAILCDTAESMLDLFYILHIRKNGVKNKSTGTCGGNKGENNG